jgi:hypothetical protein
MKLKLFNKPKSIRLIADKLKIFEQVFSIEKQEIKKLINKIV